MHPEDSKPKVYGAPPSSNGTRRVVLGGLGMLVGCFLLYRGIDSVRQRQVVDLNKLQIQSALDRISALETEVARLKFELQNRPTTIIERYLPTLTQDPAVPAPVAVQPPDKWWFIYQGEPRRWRDWKKIDETTWEERSAEGETMLYKLLSPLHEGAMKGWVLRRSTNDMDTFISAPDGDKKMYWRKVPNGPWNLLGEMRADTRVDAKAIEKAQF